MNVPRSSYYDASEDQPLEEALLVDRMRENRAEFPCYGYRRMTAQLRAEGVLVNHKRVMRLMKENGVLVRLRRRYVRTTDSNHDGPIFPNLTVNLALTGPDQLWVADITYVGVAKGFVYVAVVLDAWSRRVVGYAISRLRWLRWLPRSRRAVPIPIPAASITAIAAANMLRPGIARNSPPMALEARWDGAATLTTTPRPRAS